jgi:hypothetical protein
MRTKDEYPASQEKGNDHRRNLGPTARMKMFMDRMHSAYPMETNEVTNNIEALADRAVAMRGLRREFW